MKIEVNTLSGIALDYAVAVALGYSDFEHDELGNLFFHERRGNFDFLNLRGFRPSSKWEDGGRLIETQEIRLEPIPTGDEFPVVVWTAIASWKRCGMGPLTLQRGKTPLEAAMRSYVASQLGEEVEIPECVFGEME